MLKIYSLFKEKSINCEKNQDLDEIYIVSEFKHFVLHLYTYIYIYMDCKKKMLTNSTYNNNFQLKKNTWRRIV